MKEDALSPDESLELITTMINKAKANFAQRGSFYFLLWGVVIALSNLGHYVLMAFTSYPHPYIVWLSIIPATIVTTWYSRKKQHNSLKAHGIDRIYGQLWWAIFVSIICVLIFMDKIGYQSTPIILLLASIGTYVSGQTLRFRPLVWGGLLIFICAIVCFLIPQTEQFLVASVAMVLGYLVPGFMLKKQENARL
ncbi:MAG: hypothetical protein AAGA85_17025 [Bacteroidota bacterium]